jgi:hypothetical protein
MIIVDKIIVIPNNELKIIVKFLKCLMNKLFKILKIEFGFNKMRIPYLEMWR